MSGDESSEDDFDQIFQDDGLARDSKWASFSQLFADQDTDWISRAVDERSQHSRRSNNNNNNSGGVAGGVGSLSNLSAASSMLKEEENEDDDSGQEEQQQQRQQPSQQKPKAVPDKKAASKKKSSGDYSSEEGSSVAASASASTDQISHSSSSRRQKKKKKKSNKRGEEEESDFVPIPLELDDPSFAISMHRPGPVSTKAIYEEEEEPMDDWVTEDVDDKDGSEDNDDDDMGTYASSRQSSRRKKKKKKSSKSSRHPASATSRGSEDADEDDSTTVGSVRKKKKKKHTKTVDSASSSIASSSLSPPSKPAPQPTPAPAPAQQPPASMRSSGSGFVSTPLMSLPDFDDFDPDAEPEIDLNASVEELEIPSFHPLDYPDDAKIVFKPGAAGLLGDDEEEEEDEKVPEEKVAAVPPPVMQESPSISSSSRRRRKKKKQKEKGPMVEEAPPQPSPPLRPPSQSPPPPPRPAPEPPPPPPEPATVIEEKPSLSEEKDRFFPISRDAVHRRLDKSLSSSSSLEKPKRRASTWVPPPWPLEQQQPPESPVKPQRVPEQVEPPSFGEQGESKSAGADFYENNNESFFGVDDFWDDSANILSISSANDEDLWGSNVKSDKNTSIDDAASGSKESIGRNEGENDTDLGAGEKVSLSGDGEDEGEDENSIAPPTEELVEPTNDKLSHSLGIFQFDVDDFGNGEEAIEDVQKNVDEDEKKEADKDKTVDSSGGSASSDASSNSSSNDTEEDDESSSEEVVDLFNDEEAPIKEVDEEMGERKSNAHKIDPSVKSSRMARNRTICLLIVVLLGTFGFGGSVGFLLALFIYRDEFECDSRAIAGGFDNATATPTLSPTTITFVPPLPTLAPNASSSSAPTLSDTLSTIVPTSVPSSFSGNETLPPVPPLGPPTTLFECPTGNVPLEFRIIFDAAPGQLGLFVRDPLGVNMWNFPTGSFGSFALLLRENIFTLCLSPFQNYTLELTDTNNDGLLSQYIGVDIAGSFRIIYADEVVTTYNGDCNVDAGSGGSNNLTALECGSFCRCSYQLAVNASSGECTTNC